MTQRQRRGSPWVPFAVAIVAVPAVGVAAALDDGNPVVLLVVAAGSAAWGYATGLAQRDDG